MMKHITHKQANQIASDILRAAERERAEAAEQEAARNKCPECKAKDGETARLQAENALHESDRRVLIASLTAPTGAESESELAGRLSVCRRELHEAVKENASLRDGGSFRRRSQKTKAGI
jgi:hypothetical protein